MPKSFGYRARTRNTFARSFRKHGIQNITPYLTSFKNGEYVTIKVNGAIHDGMPHRIYHGRTGKIWNVTPRAVGVEIMKKVKGVLFRKRFHVRIEHIVKSRCNEDFEARKRLTAQVALWNNKHPDQKKPFPKREPQAPRPGYLLKGKQTVEVVEPLPFEDVL